MWQQQALLDSLLSTPMLAADLPMASIFDRSLLSLSVTSDVLNFDQKLGHLYEDALAILLNCSDHLEVLASHLQLVNASGRTLGEFDFLVRDKARQQTIHLELAVKFYLAIQVEGKWQFPGPDARDNWQRKLDRMRDHQFILGQKPEAKEMLRERFGVNGVEVRQLVYGCIFHHIKCESRVLPEAVNPLCRKGRWLYVSEWSRYFGDDERIYIIPKPLWPVEISEAQVGHTQASSVDALMVAARERCTLFATETSQEPVFLVPDDWPNF